MSDSAERNCDKCIHHINGYCDSWDCNMQTVEDVKKEAVNEYVKAVVEELEHTMSNDGLPGEIIWNNVLKMAIEIVKQGGAGEDVSK